MHKMLAALLIGATMATPVLAQQPPWNDDDRGYDQRDPEGTFDQRDRDRGPDRSVQDRRGPERRGPGAGLPGFDPRGYDGYGDDRDDRDGSDDRFEDRRFDDGRYQRGDDRQDLGVRDGGWRGDDRGDGRFANNRGDQRWQGGGGWDRDWRDDGRYDWQRQRAANAGLYRAPRYQGPRGIDRGYRRWSTGYRLAPAYYDRGYWIDRPERYRLPPAGGGYRWVRYYNDVALVDLRSGLIEDMVYGFFR